MLKKKSSVLIVISGSIININIVDMIIMINMLIVQYLMQFSGLKIFVTHVQHRFAQDKGGSTNTTRVHALLLSLNIAK